MDIIATQAVKLTVSEFVERYGQQGPFEIIDGEIVPVTPQITRSGRIAFGLARRLADYVDQRALGQVFVEVPYVLTYTPDWVKGSKTPDIMFLATDRLSAMAAADPEWQMKPIVGAPDLVVEVVSPTDRYSDVNTKVRRYLDDGVKVVWVLDAELRMVNVYTAASPQFISLDAEGVLTGGDIIPGFEIKVAMIF